jgi:SAM-dependent methyltransferase
MMQCKTLKFENAVRSFFTGIEGDYGERLIQFWIKDHIQKAKEAPPTYLMELLDNKAKSSDSMTALDACCGWGEFVANCLKNGFNCYGLDKDKTIGMGKELLEENSLPYRLVRGDAFLLPFRKETFDIIFSFNSIEHIQNLRAFFQNIHFVLKKDGILFFTFPNTIYPVDGHTMLWGVPYLPHYLAEKYVRLRKKRGVTDQWDVWYHRKRDVIQWLKIIGFKKAETFIHLNSSKNESPFFKNSLIVLMKTLRINPYKLLSIKAPMVFMIAEK